MSSINNREYKLVLYQAGLAQNHSFFDRTLSKVQMFSSSNVLYTKPGMSFQNSFIDMTYFNGESNSFFPSSDIGSIPNPHFNNFQATIADVINQLINNYPKTLHVKTQLTNSPGFIDGFESISNQKQKLKRIIGAICSYNLNIKIILIGHSQGGLVNLETAIDIPNLIHSLVSISTPFSPVSVGKNLLYLGRLLRKKLSETLFSPDSPESLQRYEDRAETLTSANYFSDLKQRWDNLESKPKLFVITGASALIRRTVTDYFQMGDPPIYVPIHTEYRFPFDGLVKIDEQKSINCFAVVDIADPSLPCFSDKDYAKSSCSHGSVSKCYSCPLPKFDPASAVFTSALDLITGGDPFSNGIVQAMLDGASLVPLKNDYYEQYYDIFASEYSHAHIAQCDETVLEILGFIS